MLFASNLSKIFTKLESLELRNCHLSDKDFRTMFGQLRHIVIRKDKEYKSNNDVTKSIILPAQLESFYLNDKSFDEVSSFNLEKVQPINAKDCKSLKSLILIAGNRFTRLNLWHPVVPCLETLICTSQVVWRCGLSCSKDWLSELQHMEFTNLNDSTGCSPLFPRLNYNPNTPLKIDLTPCPNLTKLTLPRGCVGGNREIELKSRMKQNVEFSLQFNNRKIQREVLDFTEKKHTHRKIGNL